MIYFCKVKFTPRQIEILQAASKLIGKSGPNNVTTKNLAEVMGFTEPALYRHFKSKTDILVSLIEYFKNQLSDGIELVLDKDISGFESIHQLIKFQFSLISKQPAVIMVIFAETSFQYDPVLSEAVLHLNTRLKAIIIDMIRNGMKDGSIRSDVKKEDLATIILGSMRMTVLQWRLSEFAFDLHKRGSDLCTTIKQLVQPVTK